MRYRLTALALGAMLLIGAQAGDSPEALLQFTKTTTATYADYSWVYRRDEEGERADNWAAEFHSGDWHRAEGDAYRTLSNCRTHKGWVFDVKAGTLTPSATVWVGACGISTGAQIVSVDRLAPVRDSRYGLLQTLRVTDRSYVRHYTIDKNGAIVRGNWVPANKSPAPCSQVEPLAILTKLPAGTWFTPESLRQSAVPARYKVAPKGPAPVGLSGRHC